MPCSSRRLTGITGPAAKCREETQPSASECVTSIVDLGLLRPRAFAEILRQLIKPYQHFHKTENFFTKCLQIPLLPSLPNTFVSRKKAKQTNPKNTTTFFFLPVLLDAYTNTPQGKKKKKKQFKTAFFLFSSFLALNTAHSFIQHILLVCVAHINIYTCEHIHKARLKKTITVSH